MSKKPVLYKYLVVGVIVLFIGVGIQPAFADNISLIKTSDSEEDCNLCPKASKQRLTLINGLLNIMEK